MSTLQSSMFCRYAQIPHEERWTAYSGKYVPKGCSPHSLGQRFRNRLRGGDTYALAELLQWAVGPEASHYLYEPDHVEHMACEFRKCKDGASGCKQLEETKRTAAASESGEWCVCCGPR